MNQVRLYSILLVNRQPIDCQHNAHARYTSFPRFITSVDQMIISPLSSAEARNRPSGENDSDSTGYKCFWGRIRFCFVSSVSNGFKMTIDPSSNPLINANENKITKLIEKWKMRSQLHEQRFALSFLFVKFWLYFPLSKHFLNFKWQQLRHLPSNCQVFI